MTEPTQAAPPRATLRRVAKKREKVLRAVTNELRKQLDEIIGARLEEMVRALAHEGGLEVAVNVLVPEGVQTMAIPEEQPEEREVVPYKGLVGVDGEPLNPKPNLSAF